ncbi:DUF4177 domain-containing protein [Pseudoteredinibacter isoporae]|uniref:DUF4177 domain-containing protein n=1 Tax=Pseudoteredinibacter isoporae TaxID=570281 RepID=A0A7X0JUP0_9GAMM|nr:DUF4177 domain-containing protein [Pseudoteredinibacter isoporae]MBB6522023.1 hypothetical protein [Pseudoteredinibacter isoporae]NHO87559.1 DUF4177 domain-containing protein [Pseudoteredinibacter isoporae]NIB24110.1 DUF4177 domain-containing protein [Pseudoteredinibacter isoporae]
MWEYKIIDSEKAEKGGFLSGRTIQQAEDYLNQLGAQGWEIIDLDFRMDPSMPGGPTHFHGVAKRPK